MIAETHLPDRAEALALLREYNQDTSLIQHALAVEAAMRHFAGFYHADIDQWGVIGLVHDLDYEKFPEQHCRQTRVILEEHGWPPEYIRAVVSHGYGICTDVEPQSTLEKVLFTIDELTGLIKAVALMRPSRSLSDLEVKSVKKKWKDKGFAAGVNRGLIEQGAAALGLPLDDIISLTIAGMRPAAAELGL